MLKKRTAEGPKHLPFNGQRSNVTVVQDTVQYTLHSAYIVLCEMDRSDPLHIV